MQSQSSNSESEKERTERVSGEQEANATLFAPHVSSNNSSKQIDETPIAHPLSEDDHQDPEKCEALPILDELDENRSSNSRHEEINCSLDHATAALINISEPLSESPEGYASLAHLAASPFSNVALSDDGLHEGITHTESQTQHSSDVSMIALRAGKNPVPASPPDLIYLQSVAEDEEVELEKNLMETLHRKSEPTVHKNTSKHNSGYKKTSINLSTPNGLDFYDTPSPNSIFARIVQQTDGSPSCKILADDTTSLPLSQQPIVQAKYDRVRSELMHIADNPFAKDGRKTVVTARLAENNPFAAAVNRLGRIFVSDKMKSGQGNITGDRATDFEQDLRAFVSERGIPVHKHTVIGGGDLDLYRLTTEVIQLGGAKNVVRNRAFRVVADLLDLPRSCTSSAYVLKQAYERHLFHYEQKFVLDIEPLDPTADVKLKSIVKAENEEIARKDSVIGKRRKRITQSKNATHKNRKISSCDDNSIIPDHGESQNCVGDDDSPGPGLDSIPSKHSSTKENDSCMVRAVDTVSASEQIEDIDLYPLEICKLREDLLSTSPSNFAQAIETFHRLHLKESISLQQIRNPLEMLLTRYLDTTSPKSTASLPSPILITIIQADDPAKTLDLLPFSHAISRTSYELPANHLANTTLSALIILTILSSNPANQQIFTTSKSLLIQISNLPTHPNTHPSISVAALELLLNISPTLALNLKQTTISIISTLLKLLRHYQNEKYIHQVSMSIIHNILSLGPPEHLQIPHLKHLTRHLLNNIHQNNTCILILQQLGGHSRSTRVEMLKTPGLVGRLVKLQRQGEVGATFVLRELSQEKECHELLGRFVDSFMNGDKYGVGKCCQEILGELFLGGDA